jgi:hypothetical protein
MEVLMHEIEYVSPDALKRNPRNARTHSKKQIRQLADNIVAYGFTVPVLIDENSMLLAGHGRLEKEINTPRRPGHASIALGHNASVANVCF